MRTNFKFFSLVACTFILGLFSCSNEESDNLAPEGEKKVTVKIDINGISTRAEGNTSANNVTPNFKDLRLFFTDDNFIQKVEDITSGLVNDAENSKTFTVPIATTKVYAIGNVGAISSPVSIPVAGSPVSTIQALMLEVDKQNADAKDVNLSQGQGSTGAVFDTNNEASFSLYPAIARYEIKKVSSSDNSSNKDVEQPLSEFKLTGVFITNTYRTLGLDYSTLPTAKDDIINAGPGTSDVDFVGDSIPAYLKDYPLNASNSVGLSFTPEGGGAFWQYFVMPPVTGKGTILSGNTKQETSVPMIILQISDAVTSVANGPTYHNPSYVNVRKLVHNGGINDGVEITSLKPGEVYIIDEILFGGEHLTQNPGEDHSKSVVVKVTVQNWVGVPVRPEL